MNIAVISLKGSRYGIRLLKALNKSGIEVSLLVVSLETWHRNWRLFCRTARRNGWWDACLTASRSLIHADMFSRVTMNSYEHLAEEIIDVPSVRSPLLPQLLFDRRIDLLLLGQTGIIPASILEIPTIGTLNAHPGILPKYRGVDVAVWALFHKDFNHIGSTVHWVDSGIDTGRIIKCSLYNWLGNENLQQLENNLNCNSIELMVKTVRLLQAGSVPSEPNEGGNYYHRIPIRYRRDAEKNLRRYLLDLDKMQHGNINVIVEKNDEHNIS